MKAGWKLTKLFHHLPKLNNSTQWVISAPHSHYPILLNNSPVLQYFLPFFKGSQFKDGEEMQTQQTQLRTEAGTEITPHHSVLGKWWKSSQSWNRSTESIQNVEKQLFSSTVRPGCERISSSNDLFLCFILSKPNNSWEHRTCATRAIKMSKLSIQVSLGQSTVQTSACWDIRARFKLMLEQVIAKAKIFEESRPIFAHSWEPVLLWLPPVRSLCTKHTHSLLFHKDHLNTASSVAKETALLMLPMLIFVQTKNTALN